MTTLSERDLNRALLARQLLLRRARLPIPRALERLAGLQAQYAPAMYIGLWTRLVGFERDALTRALERRTVIQATLMRATIHVVSKRDYWPFAAAIRMPRRRWWERTHPDRPRDMT
ncbi:MAG TPA: crosslink repair DNA glycosylase YcaQ family protein, partial [Gaiellaceae bacterium]|nr:crosslink repair DNA glycosylase YcaQ family protein [Gaiellaceae bacterium]